MSKQVTIGGDRLGSGNRNKVTLHGYERSTHDLSYVWRSTMASGTLVPFMSELALPGDTFDINLNVDVLTHPTIGPLFGSYKIQLDVFQIPIRLYNSKLHMNLLNVGLDMSKVAIPQIVMLANGVLDPTKPIDNQQINPSCIFSYLNMRGLGAADGLETVVTREFNAVPYLGYWDIYKNYYANKQEEIGAVIHQDVTATLPVITAAKLIDRDYVSPGEDISFPGSSVPQVQTHGYPELSITITVTGLTAGYNTSTLKIRYDQGGSTTQIRAENLFSNIVLNPGGGQIYLSGIIGFTSSDEINFNEVLIEESPFAIGDDDSDIEPSITTFPLSNIDDMRVAILQTFQDTPFTITNANAAPYGLPLKADGQLYAKQYSQEGLALKTYNSDLFNNWIQTEFIDGTGGINEITAISTAGANFTLDELNLKQKIYQMLNRIAISGGSYEDWLSAVYDNDKPRTAENPMYLGGLIRNLVFQEVISNAASADQPLGTLAGRGTVGSKKKGGEVTAKISEPSYLMGIISLTPNLDYSQGNKWDTNLKTLDDLHKPALDEIGFQDLITDQMAWFDTSINDSEIAQFKSAGKQPAWINYMTNVNQVRGNFADQTQQMFMVLNRRYAFTFDSTTNLPTIADLTTYIDPTKFNHIFADTRRDAQNFWAQIGVNITARRKMSAKVMPNL